jgi:hypothetical protein
MYLTPFVTVFREQAQKETRVLTTRGYPGLPDDEYALVESYCLDPMCDCRRVMLNVAGRHQPGGYLAAVSFGFDRDAEMAGPFLDPLNRQSQYAAVLFAAVTQILSDPAYVARLEAHYHQIKRAAGDPRDPAYETIRRLRLDQNRLAATRDRAMAGARKTTTSARKKKQRKK